RKTGEAKWLHPFLGCRIRSGLASPSDQGQCAKTEDRHRRRLRNAGCRVLNVVDTDKVGVRPAGTAARYVVVKGEPAAAAAPWESAQGHAELGVDVRIGRSANQIGVDRQQRLGKASRRRRRARGAELEDQTIGERAIGGSGPEADLVAVVECPQR